MRCPQCGCRVTDETGPHPATMGCEAEGPRNPNESPVSRQLRRQAERLRCKAKAMNLLADVLDSGNLPRNVEEALMSAFPLE